jgi:hypothetical protein
MKLINTLRQSDLGSKKTGTKHHTQDFSSQTAIKRKIQSKVVHGDQKSTLFGATNNGLHAPNKGNSSDYIHFKSIYSSLSLFNVTKR